MWINPTFTKYSITSSTQLDFGDVISGNRLPASQREREPEAVLQMDRANVEEIVEAKCKYLALTRILDLFVMPFIIQILLYTMGVPRGQNTLLISWSNGASSFLLNLLYIMWRYIEHEHVIYFPSNSYYESQYF